MSGDMTDGRAKRVANDTAMVFMGRTMERLFGADVLDAMVSFLNKKKRKQWAAKSSGGEVAPGFFKCLFSEDAHEFTIIRDDGECLEVEVTRCVHADVFRSFNAEDLGEKLICSGDYAVVEGFNAGVELERPCTCMTGKSCRFIFRKKA